MISILSENSDKLTIIDSSNEDTSENETIQATDGEMIDVNRIAKVIIGSKGVVIRWLQRKYKVKIVTHQDYTGTKFNIVGEHKPTIDEITQIITEYNEDPISLHRMLAKQSNKLIRIFIDISNIIYGIPKGDTEHNPDAISNHINIPVLIEIAKDLRHAESITVVGSSPDRENRFWQLFGDKTNIYIQKRSIREDGSSMETDVDDKLHELIRKDIEEIPPNEQVILIMSGDGNDNRRQQTTFPMVIKEALEKGWYIELMCWRRTLNRLYQTLEHEWRPKFKIVLLDDFQNDIVMTQSECDRPRTRSAIKHRRSNAQKRYI